MRITRSIVIEAPLDTVWHTAAHEFERIGEWASLVSESKAAEGDPPNTDADVAGRVCETSFGKTFEIFETYDEANHTFTYGGGAERQPPGITSATNTWTVERVSAAKSRLTMSADMKLNAFPGMLVRVPMRLQLPRLLDMNLEEIKHYIETGKPHPRKVKAMQKAAA